MLIEVFTDINKLYTLAGGVRTGDYLNEANILTDAWIAVADGFIMAVGQGEHPYHDVQQKSLSNNIVIPGLIDAHSHLIFAGERSNEYEAKIKGASYLEILANGGGILSTVNATRNASERFLLTKTKDILAKVLANGVTTMEIKSGYGLDLKTELKQLEVAKNLNQEQEIELISTYMGAHARPDEFSDSYEYLYYCISQVLPLIKEHADFVDIFLDEGVFDYRQAEFYLSACKNLGWKLKLHIDEITNLNGSELAIALNATSVEHCMVTSKTQMIKLAQAKIPGILLPMTSFNLQKLYANAALMKESGMILGLGSDYNPGSCPCFDLLLIMRVASRVYGLLPCEILAMCTINNAYALTRDSIIGSIEVNKQADFVVLEAKDFQEVIARMDFNPVKAVYKKGKEIHHVD